MSHQSIKAVIEQLNLENYANFKIQLRFAGRDVTEEYDYNGYCDKEEQISVLFEKAGNGTLLDDGDESLIWVKNDQLITVLNFIKTLGGNVT